MGELLRDSALILAGILCLAGTIRSQSCEEVADDYHMVYPIVNELTEPNTVVAAAPVEVISGN